MSRLKNLDRIPGNIEPKEPYKEKKQSNLEELGKSLEKQDSKEEKIQKINNQKVSLKVGDRVKEKLEAQKTIEAIKFDYEMIEILLDRNAKNYSQRDKAKYSILIDEIVE